MSGPVPVRGATAADLPPVRALLAACGLPPEGVESCLEDCLVVERDGTLLGCAALDRCADAVLLRSLAVANGARRQGLAAALVDALLARARSAGASRVWLLTDSAADWFAARGWRDTPRADAPPGIRDHAQFRHLCPASARLMCADL